MGREFTNKSIGGLTVLHLFVPIKPGVIDAYESITYESRLRSVAEAVHRIERNVREHELIAPFSDVAQRILNVFKFSIGVLDKDFNVLTPDLSSNEPGALKVEPQRYMLLTATFDGPFEPYLRLIWKPLGPFLDLLLCNCVGYPLSSETGFPEYIDWVRRNQVEPSVFYSSFTNTLRDQFYLGDLERLQREQGSGDAADKLIAEMTATYPEPKAEAIWQDPNVLNLREPLRIAFEALHVLYSLAPYYPPDRKDGEGAILLRAARELLFELAEKVERLSADPIMKKGFEALGLTGAKIGPYTEHWKWFTRSDLPQRHIANAELELPTSEIQRGLLSDYDSGGFRTTHGITLLCSIADPLLAGASILEKLEVSWEDGEPFSFDWFGDQVGIYRNVAFTSSGLQRMQLDPADYAKFPKEFRDGLFERAPLIGDQRDNHPRRWSFPPRFDPKTRQDDAKRPRIHSEEIDVVIQLRIATKYDPDKPGFVLPNPAFKSYEQDAAALLTMQTEADLEKLKQIATLGFQDGLAAIVAQAQAGAAGLQGLLLSANDLRDDSGGDGGSEPILDGVSEPDILTFLTLLHTLQRDDGSMLKMPGLKLLAIEPTFRPLGPYNGPLPEVEIANRDHFGFVDGISQPEPSAMEPVKLKPHYENRVPYGEILCGHSNSRGDSAEELNWNGSRELMANGSFMVFRKIEQFPQRLEELGGAGAEDVQAIVGRTADGAPLVPGLGNGDNDFTYANDPKQGHCPFASHVRLANPRESFQGSPAPRILRRGMAYGSRYDSNDAASKSEPRGVLFMAFCASLAEQYEVIQRWLNGGNATGLSSAAIDPLTGVWPEPGTRPLNSWTGERQWTPYTFRYVDSNKQVRRVKLTKPLTELRWGLYAFMPSKPALEKICGPKQPVSHVAQIGQGQSELDRLLALNGEEARREWKRLLEDFNVKDLSDLGKTPPVWRAIRERHNGVLRLEGGLPYGEGKVTHGLQLANDSKAVVLVADGDLIRQVLVNAQDFSSSERLVRANGSVGAHYVTMDPDPKDTEACPRSRYATEAIEANRVIFEFSNDRQDAVFAEAYRLGKYRLDEAKRFNKKLRRDFFKIDLRRDYIVSIIGNLCRSLFDIPDASVEQPDIGFIDAGPWAWEEIDAAAAETAAEGKRKPRCPGDFMAPSRFSFYPRPAPAIQNYGVDHGKGLRAASLNLIKKLREVGFKGQISALLADKFPQDDDLLARNLVGGMTGAIPPIDGNLRGIFFDWIDGDTLWRHQSSFLAGKTGEIPTLAETEAAIGNAVKTAMCKRPAPDLLYRTATRDTTIGDKVVKSGETVILALVSPMLASLDQVDPTKPAEPDIEHVFGGYRKAAWQEADDPAHACPAYRMSMAIIYGAIAALFDSGRIIVQPASMILQVKDWDGPKLDTISIADLETAEFSPFD